MTNAYRKDILRTIKKSRKRFLAIMVITILGVTMFSGLQAACQDLRVTGDRFFDAQDLHDLQILSTLGLTDEDVEVLNSLDLVEAAEGIYSETVSSHIGENDFSFTLQTMPSCGIDTPYVVDGRLPDKADECAVTEQFLNETGLSIGDTVTIQEDLSESDDSALTLESDLAEDSEEADDQESTEDPNFLVTTYRITAAVVDATDVNNPGGATCFRCSQIEDLTILILPEAVSTDVYTSVLLRLKDGEDLFCYGDSYKELISSVEEEIQSEIKDQREQARYDQILADANQEIDDAEADARKELEDAKAKLLDGQKELNEKLLEGYQELIDAQEQIRDGKLQIADALKLLDTSEKKLEEGASELAEGKKQLEEGKQQLEEGKRQLQEQEASAAEQIASARSILSSISSAGSSLSSDAEGKKEQAIDLTGDQFPQNSWDSAVSTISGKVTPAISSVMSEVDLSSLDADELAEISSMITSGSADPARLAEILQGHVTEESAREALQQIYQAAADMSASDWEQTMEDVSSTGSALADLSASYDQAAAEEIADLQKQIDEIRTADPQPEEAEEQIASLEERQQLIADSAVRLPGAAIEAAVAASLSSVLSQAESEIDAQEASAKEQIAQAWDTLHASETELEEAEAEIAANEKLIADSRKTIAASRKTIAEKQAELAEGEQELAEGWEEYYEGKAEGESELAEGWQQYYDGEAELNEQLADAREKLSEIDVATWYIQDRDDLSGYHNIESDADSIDSIGTVFPAIFLIVAILISLTTITRMVEEDRGLIGTYKALGFSDGQIRRKYTIYSGCAALAGGLVGTIFAFIVLPLIICHIFHVMYLLPVYRYVFLPVSGLAGPVLFLAGVLLAAWITCRTELKITPAILMRPKAPKGGNRVFLEYIPFLWNHMSFLNKVTARNLFRYKKRLFMTIAGTAGCMALLLFGFAVKDSVHDLMPRQYEQTFHYDLLAVVQPDDNEKLLSYFDGDENIEKLTNLEISSVTLKYQGQSQDVQLMVFPDTESLEEYITLYSKAGQALDFRDGDIVITYNASSVMGFSEGDTVSLQLQDLQQEDLTVTSITMNYLSNYIYMTADTFENYFNAYEPNGVLIQLSEACSDPVAYASELKKKDGILSCLSTQDLKDTFSDAFLLMNLVVYVIIVMSAALAFVVLFTLSTTNISERERELATIKVLGFYDNEVHLYVDKEALLLTAIGVVTGIPLGKAFAGTLSVILNIPSVYLAVSLHPVSYLISASLSMCFAVAVNLIMDRTLDRINPAEALKSVE